MTAGRRLPRAEAGTGLRLRSFFERVAMTALEEDLGGTGPDGDATTVATVPADMHGEASVVAKAEGTVCGLEALEAVFNAVGGGTVVSHERVDGDEVVPGDALARLTGPVRSILAGERTALNLLGHLSGIATLTRAFVRRASGVTVTDTRKTLPGLRILEKYAVRAGGGENHRFALWDGVLVKDNHIAACGGVAEATRRAKAGSELPVQVECGGADEALAAAAAGADAVLLDNLDPSALTDVVSRVRAEAPDVVCEASGGVTLETIEAYAKTGVDRISVGALTHSAPALDVSLRLVRTWKEGE